jgi:branched-chain amino acid aminotransferase
MLVWFEPRWEIVTMTSWTYIDGTWHEGNPKILGPMSHATWLSSIIFDGARAFEGCAPDLDRHCERAVNSSRSMGLRSMLSAGEVEQIAREGISRFPKNAELYIRPMFFAEDGWIYPDADSTRFTLSVYDNPMPAPTGFSVCLSRFRRPAPDQAPTDAKASCLYPNSGRALRDAQQRGFDNGVVLDPLGNVAELATANLMLVKDGVAITPAANGTFLAGITRRRVLELLRGAGCEAQERTVSYDEVLQADELFSVGNHGKVLPITRIEQRHLQPGPIFTKARKLYWEFAHST